MSSVYALVPCKHSFTQQTFVRPWCWSRTNSPPLILCCADTRTLTSSSSSSSPQTAAISPSTAPAPPVIKKRKRYRRQYPGENEGITEEMRFFAMRLRNLNGKKYTSSDESRTDDEDSGNSSEYDAVNEAKDSGDDGSSLDGSGETWQPSTEGFIKYLVDSQLVFNTVERIVDEANHVAYAYFRKTGLERSEGLSKDIEWFREQGNEIPEPSTPGVSYAKYLEELAERSAPLFLAHFYNIYFSHIAGGQVIANKVSEKLLEQRELDFYRWDGDERELLKGAREKLNMLGEHWSRDDRNKCLKEAAKSYKFLGQIVRLIIL